MFDTIVVTSNVVIVSIIVDISIIIFVVFSLQWYMFEDSNNGGGITTTYSLSPYQLVLSSIPPTSASATMPLSVA